MRHKKRFVSAGILLTAASLASAAVNGVMSGDAVNDFQVAKASYLTGSHQALPEVETFIADYPSSSLVPEARLMQGAIYLSQGDAGKALEIFNKIPVNAFAGSLDKEFRYLKAYALLKTGYFQEAMPLFRSLSGDSQYGDAATFYEAYIDYVGGDYRSAYPKFQKVTRRGEKGLEAEYYLNQMDFAACNYDKVINSARDLLDSRIAPELLPETLRVTGLSHFKTGDKRSAKSYLEQYVDVADVPEIKALYALGTIYYDEGRLSDAEALFSQLIDDRNDIAQSSWLYLGQIYSLQGNDAAATMAFDKATRMAWNPEISETASYNLSVASAQGNSLPFVDSAEIMESFMQTYPESVHASEISRYLASAYYNQRNYEKALAALGQVEHKGPEADVMRQKILLELGKSEFISGETDQAIKNLERAEAIASGEESTLAAIRLWLGEAYYAKGRYPAAFKMLSSALDSGKLGGDAGVARYDAGYSLFKQKQYSKALPYFKGALDAGTLNPQLQTDARLRYGDCLYYTGDYSHALAEYLKVTKAEGQQGVYASMREADILALQGDVTEEIKILNRLADKGAGVWTKDVLTRLGDAYSMAGEDGKAAQIYARLLDSGISLEESRQMYFSLAANAEKLYKAGDTKGAYALYDRLARSGEEALYQDAVIGLMRTADQCDEIEDNALKVMDFPVQPDVITEAEVRLAECQLKNGKEAQAEKRLTEIIDEGGDGGYWLARAYIALADIYSSQDKDTLAAMYLETLRDNYPGNEKDIFEMINSRLKTLKP